MQFHILFFAFLIEKSIQKSIIQTRVFGGKPAAAGQFPYQALLMSDAGNCGGILISDRHILTAAHCVYNVITKTFYVPMAVLFGGYDLDIIDGVEILTLESSDNFIVHKDYDRITKQNDIALINLPSPINFTRLMSPVKLPKRSYDDSYLAGRKVISTGFGDTSDHDNSTVSTYLYYTKSAIVPHNECIELYLHQYHPDSHICINTSGHSICSGDSGGPNVIKDDLGNLVLVGITVGVSPEGCTKNLPQVLTRITHYLDWIHEKTGIPIRN